MSIFAQRMRELREEKGWTQEEAAERLGMQRPTVAGYESFSKKRIPREKTLLKIADVYETSTDYLLGNTDERYKAGSKKLKNHPLGNGPAALLETIELTDDLASKKIKDLFTNKGKELSDKAVKEILEFSRYQADRE